MSAKFDVKMTDKILYDFWMNHTYRSFSGVFSIVFGVALLLLAAFIGEHAQPYMRVLYLLFGLYFLLLQPITLYLRSKSQMKTNKVFQKPITYEIDDAGIRTTQEDQTSEMTWEMACKVTETKNSYLIYTGKRNSFVLPKESMGSQITIVQELIKKHMKQSQVKMK